MADGEEIDAQELAMLVKRLDRQRRARMAADAISEHSTGVLYDKQQHLRLLQAVAVAANESPSLDDALQAAVDQICTHLGWPVGHAYLTITSVLALSDVWFINDLARFERLRRALEMTPIVQNASLTGRALRQTTPVIATELEAHFPLPVAVAAKEAGLVSAVAFAIVGVDAPVAVLEFFTTETIEPDGALIEVIGRIGELVGRVDIRTRADATLRNSEEQYRLLFEGNPHPMWIHDSDSMELIAVNDAAVSEYGYTREDLLALTLADLFPAGVELPLVREGTVQLQRKDGTIAAAELTGYDLRLPGRHARMSMAVDIDAGRRAADELRESERRFREMLDTIQLAAVLLDVVGMVTYCNPYLLRITGYGKDEVVGKNFFDIFLPEERRGTGGREFIATIGRGVLPAHAEMEIVTRNGGRRIILWNNTVLRNPQRSVLGAASIGSDVTEQRQAEKQLLHSAFHDALTGLPNRALFMDRVEHALDGVRRDGRRSFAVLLLDVDHFKNVNDSLGHAAGDELLVEIGERLLRSVRGVDTVARFGGDEFTILVEQVFGPADATRTAVRVQNEFDAPFRIGDNEIFTSISIGIIIAGAEYEAAEQIVRDADTAMYRAKAQGRARAEIFDANMRAEVVARLQLETDLRHALERNELRVFYQPIVRIPSLELIGFEALARWQHPIRGLLTPGEFIPIAEESGLIVAIGQFVLREACQQVSQWLPLHVNVNISSRHFGMADLVSDVKAVLAHCNLPPEAMHIEVTESAIMQHTEAALATLNELRTMGTPIALDDFGTGYSSLSYLHQFPIDQLKIDASFVREAPRERKNLEIIRSILALGNGLGLEVIAEGVETEQQRDLLVSLGCEFAQGYLFAVPMAPADATKYISKRT